MKSYRKVLDINYTKRRGYINIAPEVQNVWKKVELKKNYF